MCGIVGYIGFQDARPILIRGLEALEYRGYDSAGLAVLSDRQDQKTVVVQRTVGRPKNLRRRPEVKGTLGIGHTRWATHGGASEANCHPHSDCGQRIFVVHNGVIENHRELRKYLQGAGHTFTSGTDTEVVPHLIEDFIGQGKSFREALFATLRLIRGAYALLVMDAENPDVLYAVRQSSPLIIGIGFGHHVASAAAGLVGFTTKVFHLEDGQVAEISRETVLVTNMDEEPVEPDIVELQLSLEEAQLGEFPHYMLKEIFEGPEVVEATCRGRLDAEEGSVKLGGLEEHRAALRNARRIIIVACGTSYYAGLIGEYLFEEISEIPTEVHVASEFRYREQPFEKGTVVLVISQSGETADTIGALEKAKAKGLLMLGIVNVVGSTISRMTDAGVYNHAGPEIGVASTKAFLSQVTVLVLMALYLWESRTRQPLQDIMVELENIPEKIRRILSRAGEIEALAKKYCHSKNFMFLGRRLNFPTALEGALKLKEISYLHAEGYGAGELKHGPLALIDQHFPTIALVSQNEVTAKMYSNLEEIRAREGTIIAVATEGDEHIGDLAKDVIFVPATSEWLSPLLMVVPLQLFAYYMSVQLGHNVDKPRNLAKSVTVE